MTTQYTSSLPWITRGTTPTITFTTPFNANMIVAGGGIILKSPNGTRFKITVDDSGEPKHDGGSIKQGGNT